MTDSTNDIFNLTGNETPEELDALLDQMEEFEVTDELPTNDPAPVVAPVVDHSQQDTLGTDTDAASEAAGADTTVDDGEQGKTEDNPDIETKDGKHTIPYAVLEAERNEAARLKEQLDEERKLREQEQEQRAALERESKLLNVRNKQLEEMGIKPADLPEELDMSGDALAELQENYPELAPYIQSLNAKIEQLSTSAAPAAPVPTAPAPQPHNDVAAALNANTDLTAWREAGGDKWKVALDIDDSLLADPAWRSKTHAERLDEVARRTKAAFGESDSQTKAKAEQAQAHAQASLPASPSELGVTNEHEGTLAQRAAKMNPEELNGLFESLDPDDIEAILAEAEGL